ncbi:MAG: UDP-glucose/GDP-mannose dehydrogenase family protein [Deltaproteobacteria bacterium]|nr:MAG: UDP-glucose/GDP-mannose dehydrogenase family protein [Deltaproteobacteria bacterium]
MRIAVVGTGYVGLVAGAGFSDFGNDVTCVDIDADRVARLRRGELPIYEPGLDAIVDRNVAGGRLRFTTDVAEAVAGADVVLIAVGTPQGSYGGGARLEHVFDAARSIGRALTGWAVIATKSTVPVGTARRVREIIAEETRHPFAVASNPEFLKEGDAVNDFMKPARVIVGCDDERGIATLRNLYAPFVRTNDRILVTDVQSAELAKYAANAMLATRISFMNELALLAEAVGADIEAVRRGIGSDPRIGPKFLFPGPGFGGSCFPKDIRALAHTARGYGVELSVVEAADRANERQKRVLGARIRERIGGDGGTLTGKRIAVWGLAFKPETDDVRESPALALIDDLLAAGAAVTAYDPQAIDTARRELGDRVTYAPDMYAAVEGADALALVTEWKVFRRPDFSRVAAAMRTRAVFDGRNVWNPAELAGLGFAYYGIGRPRNHSQ